MLIQVVRSFPNFPVDPRLSTHEATGSVTQHEVLGGMIGVVINLWHLLAGSSRRNGLLRPFFSSDVASQAP